MGGAEDALSVAETFGEVARALADQEDLDATLDKIVKLAVNTIDACEEAGILLVRSEEVTSAAATGDVPRTLDRIQASTGEGPCFDAIKEHEVFRTANLENDDRWPRFSRRAHEETGVRSIIGLRLFMEDDTMGALNLYSTAPNAFDDTDVALGSVFAAHAAVAMKAARREEQLEQKAETRDVIGRAKGILMARSGVSDDEAFNMLVKASQRMNIKLREVARRIADQELPPEPPPE